MQNLRNHSRLLSLFKISPLDHVLLHPNYIAAASSSSAIAKAPVSFIQSTTNHVRPFSKMSESGEIDDSNSDDNGSILPSTVEDVNILSILLNEVMEARRIGGRNSISEEKLKSLCGMYKFLSNSHRHDFIVTLATDYAVDHSKVAKTARILSEMPYDNPIKFSKCEDTLRIQLTPQYSWLFTSIGKLDNGVKFLVDLRADILKCLYESQPDSTQSVALQQLNTTLRELLSMWFSVGFLKLERITWRSPCEMLQKISEYEAVHPVRSWTDIKRRVGPYRRCFVFVHSSMATEPLVVLHTALCDEIPSSLAGIVSSRSRMSADLGNISALSSTLVEDADRVKAGIFYSITSTQRGLQGIDLGNYLIKRVVRELQAEFPKMTQFSTLSPIPSFRPWLLEKIKASEKGDTGVFTPEELESLRTYFDGDVYSELRRVLKNNSWVDIPNLSSTLSIPLLRLCARYLYAEKRRGLALCSVANFHLSNGAVLWRINWAADLSIRGLSNSCGIMVNYRYFLEDTEQNSSLYLEKQEIAASEEVRNLSAAAQAQSLLSKM